MTYISSNNPDIYTLTYENQHIKIIEAFSFKIDNKFIKFYNYVGEFQEMVRAKRVIHMKRVRKQ